MANLPGAVTRVSDTAAIVASGLDVVCILSPCAESADAQPTQFGTAAAVYAEHGYCEGVEYAALHAERTGKPFLFCGLPIATAGVLGRFNSSGNTGSSVVTAAAGGAGCLAEHDGQISVDKGGIVGTDQIVLLVSMDAGRKTKKVRLGTGTSYVIPYFNVTVSFAAGTLVAGDVVLEWHGSAPRSDSDGWAAAFDALAEQQKGFRSSLLCGDLQTHTDASAYLAQLDAYETEHERFIYGRASVLDRLPQAALSHSQVRMTGAPSLTFVEVGGTGDTITRSAGSWITDGFAVGDIITVTLSSLNNVTGPIASLTALVITLGTTDLAAEVAAGCVVVGTPGLTFTEIGASGDTITRSRGSWLDDGFRVGDKIRVTGSASNNITAAQGLATVTASVLTLGTDDLAAEVVGAFGVTIVAGQTKAAWMAAIDAEFAPIDAAPRIDLSAGRGRVLSPFSGWLMRRPAAWAASCREYQHDLHVPTWKKSLGNVGFDLFDANNLLVEWDDRADGAAGVAARFTCLRTWGNGPRGAFIALSLTRAGDSSLRSQTHNLAVVNLTQTIVQLNSENAGVGRDFDLNDDGTATTDALSSVQSVVQNALDLDLLGNKTGEGKRASSVVWTPNPDDIYNVPEATMGSVTELNLKGTVFRVSNLVHLKSGGQ